MDENIFANPSTPSSVDAPTSDFGSTAAAETNITMQMRTRTNGNATSGGSVGGGGHHPPPAGGIIDRLVDRVVSEQEKWKSSVEVALF